MAFTRIDDMRFVITKLPNGRGYIQGARATFSGRCTSFAVRITFGVLVGALLYSIVTSTARADDTGATARNWQSLASIRAVAEQYVRDNSGSQIAASTSLIVTAAELDTRLTLERCANELTAFVLNSAPIGARTTIGVRCALQPQALQSATTKSPGAEWTVYVPVTTESDIDVLVLRNSMPRDAHLAAGDFDAQRRRVPGVGAAYPSSLATLRDQHLKRSTPAGTVLMTEMLSRDLVVKRGQQVTLVFGGGGMSVQAPGLALADGGTSDRIRVQNQSSLKIVEGIIESGNLVRVGM